MSQIAITLDKNELLLRMVEVTFGLGAGTTPLRSAKGLKALRMVFDDSPEGVARFDEACVALKEYVEATMGYVNDSLQDSLKDADIEYEHHEVPHQSNMN